MVIVPFRPLTHTHTQCGEWDLIIAHPPCTYLSGAGNGYFDVSKYGDKAIQRYVDRTDAAIFFMVFLTAECKHIAIENPVGFMNGHYRKPNQSIHPYYFAASQDDFENYHKKKTCLWLKGLPNLERFTAEVMGGGTGYCISLVNGKEVFDKSKDIQLPYEVEHSFPDYSLYGIKDTAYGFMSRGCPRGCDFCHVKDKEGLASIKVADLDEFWNGQKYIQLLDPNTLACRDWKDILQQLIDSKAHVDMNQGVDIRMMTEEKAEMLRQIKLERVHFAYDRFQDKEMIEPRFRQLQEVTGWGKGKVTVYVLCGFDTTMEQNIDRIMFLRSLNFQPYVMLYDKEHIPKGHELRKLQRWVNSPYIFWSCPTFSEYQRRE